MDSQAVLLKTYIKALEKSLHILFKTVSACGNLPNILNDRINCPVYKRGNRADAINYRLVFLTSHIRSIRERVFKGLISFVEKNNILTNTQHNFRPGRRWLIQQLHHFDLVLKEQL